MPSHWKHVYVLRPVPAFIFVLLIGTSFATWLIDRRRHTAAHRQSARRQLLSSRFMVAEVLGEFRRLEAAALSFAWESQLLQAVPSEGQTRDLRAVLEHAMAEVQAHRHRLDQLRSRAWDVVGELHDRVMLVAGLHRRNADVAKQAHLILRLGLPRLAAPKFEKVSQLEIQDWLEGVTQRIKAGHDLALVKEIDSLERLIRE